jgi:hypothetical protein
MQRPLPDMTTRTYHIDPAHGDDTNDGLSPARPVKNHAELDIRPGDTVLFKCGSVIRGMLHTRSGQPGWPIRYGAYGEGADPVFLGSVPASDADCWRETRPSVWRYTGALQSEVCNLVFDGGESCGILRWEAEDLREPGDWHDTSIGTSAAAESGRGSERRGAELFLCSETNPALAWKEIECVLWGERKLVDGQRHLILEDLRFENAGVHGYHQVGAEDVVIRRCAFRFIGGAVWHRQHRIRFGNGVEFWDGASDIVVEGCVFDNIYDSAATHQGGETRNIPERIRFCDNLFVDCGLSAYESREPSREIYFEHNTCINSGGGFSVQGEVPPRSTDPYPQPVGYHVFIFLIDANTQPGPVYIRHNIFYGGYGAAINAVLDPADEGKFVLDHNAYWQTPDKPLLQFSRLEPGLTWQDAMAAMLAQGSWPLDPDVRVYSAAEFGHFQARSGQDAHSRVALPLFVDPAHGDYRQRVDSPCRALGARSILEPEEGDRLVVHGRHLPGAVGQQRL